MKPEAVFFDLDGTLADTAPDLGCALNRIRTEEGLPPLPLSAVRPYVSQGVRGLLNIGFNMLPDNASYAGLYKRVLDQYAAATCVESFLFEGIAELLDSLDAHGIPWGIITNKHERFTAKVVHALQLGERARVVVSGNTTAAPKPAPDPMRYACEKVGVNPLNCWYIGDDLRDVQAAHASGMRAIAATYGYLGTGDPPALWQADALAASPREILGIVLPELAA